MLQVCVVYEQDQEQLLTGVLGLQGQWEPGIDSEHLLIARLSTHAASWPEVERTPHLVVLAVAGHDPSKTRARAWLRKLRAVLPGPELLALFVGEYAASQPPMDAGWAENTIERLPADSMGAADALVEQFANLAGPRLLVIDDEREVLDGIRALPTFPFVDLDGHPRWIVPVCYQVEFGQRHQEANKAWRRQMTRLAQTVAELVPTIVLLDVLLGKSNGFEECRAVAYELLAGTSQTCLAPVSRHVEKPDYKRFFALLHHLFPQRVYRPVDKTDFSGATLQQALNTWSRRSITSQSSETVIHQKDVVASVPLEALAPSLRLAALTWLSSHHHWVLHALNMDLNRQEAHLVYFEREAFQTVPEDHFRDFKPARHPRAFFKDWNPIRLSQPSWWREEASQPSAWQKLYPRRADVTIGCYIDVDSLAPHKKNELDRLARTVVEQCVMVREEAVKQGKKVKVWFVMSGNDNSIPSEPARTFLRALYTYTAAADLFEEGDLDRFEVRVVPAAPEAADSALLTLVQSDGFTTRKIIVTEDQKLNDQLQLEVRNCEEMVVVVFKSKWVTQFKNVRVVQPVP